MMRLARDPEPFAQHMPDNGQVGAKDAAEGLKDGICAERDIVPCKVCAAAAEDDSESDGGYNACSVKGFC
jgi:hypothetical protein